MVSGLKLNAISKMRLFDPRSSLLTCLQ